MINRVFKFDDLVISDIMTPRAKIFFANAMAEKLLGRKNREILKMHQSEIHPPGEAEKYKGIFKRHLAHESNLEELEVLLPESELIQDGLEKMKQRFLELKQLSREEHFEVIVFFIPSRFMVDEKLRENLATAYAVQEKLDPDAIPNQLKDFLENERIPVFYPKQEMIDASGLKLYYPIDAHFNLEGNSVYGEYVALILNQEYLDN